MDIECDSKNLDQVIRMLQREVHSVNYATNIAGEEVVPMTPLSASFGRRVGGVKKWGGGVGNLRVLSFQLKLD